MTVRRPHLQLVRMLDGCKRLHGEHALPGGIQLEQRLPGLRQSVPDSAKGLQVPQSTQRESAAQAAAAKTLTAGKLRANREVKGSLWFFTMLSTRYSAGSRH